MVLKPVPSGGKGPKALLVTVHFKGTDSLRALLDNLQRLKGTSEVAVTIADNSTAEDGLSSIRCALAQVSNVELLESPTNRGYFGAARFALDSYFAFGKRLPDWVIVCNHDVLIEDREFFEKLFQLDPRSAGVIAPRIRVSGTNLDQNPFMWRRPNWLRWASLRFIYSNYWLAAFWHWLSRQKQALRSHWSALRSKTASIPNGRREFIYAPHGAFFIFSRRYFEAGGYLDGNLFLYGEEISVAEICRSLGLPVIYEPALCVLHNEHRSTGHVISRFSYECQRNALQYIASHYLATSQKMSNPSRLTP
jgi:GT2 family glycosyltransferase